MYGVTAVVQCVMSATVRARAVRRSQVRQRLYNLLNGDEGLAMWCGRVMTVLIIASLLPLCFKESSPILETIEYGCVLVFIVDYLARWVTADLKLRKGALSFVIYPFTPMAIIDLLSILPVFNALNDALRTLRVLRLFRALRLRHRRRLRETVGGPARRPLPGDLLHPRQRPRHLQRRTGNLQHLLRCRLLGCRLPHDRRLR